MIEKNDGWKEAALKLESTSENSQSPEKKRPWEGCSVDVATQCSSKQFPAGCIISDQRKRKHSKNTHVHFTFDDFHCFKSQDEIKLSEIQPAYANNGSGVSNKYVPKCSPEILEVTKVLGNKIPISQTEISANCVYSKRQWQILIIILLSEITSAMLISFQSPLYPAEAEKKGLSATQFGIVFGVFEFTVFLVSPIFGKYMGRINPKTQLNMGILTTGITAILFGFLDRTDNPRVFLWLSLGIRALEGIGDAAFVTSSFVIAISEFPESTGTTFALESLFYGLGLLIGPIFGGYLFQVGGFTLPFLILGSTQLTMSLLIFFAFPKIETRSTNFDFSSGIMNAIRIPSVAFTSLGIFGAALSTGFLSASLEPHIRQFELSPVVTGSVFLIGGGTYAISSPFWGWVCDRKISPKYVSIFGAILILIAFLLIGPAPFFPFESVLGITCVGLAIYGLGLGGTLVSSFSQAIHELLQCNFPDDFTTYGIVSGLWTSVFTLGNTCGPVVSGIMLENVGFRSGTIFIVVSQTIVISVAFIFVACHSDSDRKVKAISPQAQSPAGCKGTEREFLLSKI